MSANGGSSIFIRELGTFFIVLLTDFFFDFFFLVSLRFNLLQYRNSNRRKLHRIDGGSGKTSFRGVAELSATPFFSSHFIDLQNQTFARKAFAAVSNASAALPCKNEYLSNAQARLKTGRTPSITGRQQDKSRSPSARHGAVCGEQMRGGAERAH